MGRERLNLATTEGLPDLSHTHQGEATSSRPQFSSEVAERRKLPHARTGVGQLLTEHCDAAYSAHAKSYIDSACGTRDGNHGCRLPAPPLGARTEPIFASVRGLTSVAKHIVGAY